MTPTKCEQCDHACDNPYNEDGECLGRMTKEERETFYQLLAAEYNRSEAALRGEYAPKNLQPGRPSASQ